MTPPYGSILITGGAGFIGCELSSQLVERGADVTVMDMLHPQVHRTAGWPARLHPGVRLLPLDVTVPTSWSAALQLHRPDVVVHLAAETGTGQSLTEASRHGLVNVVGTTRLTDALGSAGVVPSHVVLASSRAVYGEGTWVSGGLPFRPGARRHADLAAGRWDPVGPGGSPAHPEPHAAERTAANPTSVYGATKLAQEHILSAWCAAVDSPLSILRLQNVYGPGQALENAYTGIMTLFARQARAGREIDVYEDGRILRDFVFVDDVVDAFLRTLDGTPDEVTTLDIGSGRAVSIAELAAMLADRLGSPEPRISGTFRDGDVRAAVADPARAERELGWRPRCDLGEGIDALLTWLDKQTDTGAP